MDVDPKTNELYVADGDGGAQRVMVFDVETGAFKRLWARMAQGRVWPVVMQLEF